MMMFCGQCGKAIDDDSLFCRHCGAAQKPSDAVASTPSGAPFPSATATPSTRPVSGPQGSSGGINTGKIFGVIAAVVLLVLFISSLDSSPSAPVASAADDAVLSVDAGTSNAATSATPAEPESPWSYSTDEDKVRGGTTYFAATTSTNSISQESPYDSVTTMRMTVRKSPAYGTDIVLTISSGQLMCSSYSGCNGTVRFDDGSAQPISFNGSADNSSDTIFVEGAMGFLQKLKKAKKVIIEKTVYQAGSPQFEFDVRGLKWDH